MKNVRKLLVLPKDLHEQIRIEAGYAGINMSAFIRVYLRKVCKVLKTKREVGDGEDI